MRLIVPLAVLVTALCVALFASRQRGGPSTVSGFVESDQIRVGSRVGGRILAVHVEEGTRVVRGTPMIEFEHFDLDARRADAAALREQADARLALVRAGSREEEIAAAGAERARLAADLAKLEKGPREQEIATQRARVKLDEALLELAKAEDARVEDLFQRKVASASDRDNALARLRAAEADLEVRQQELALLLEGTRKEDLDSARAGLTAADARLALVRAGSRKEEIAQADAAAQAATAALAAIDAQLAELRVLAPIDGIVEAIDVRPGDMAAPNQPILALADPTRLWVRTYVPENRLDLAPDQPLDVIVDSFPGRVFHGRVGFVARHAEFTPGNIQTPEERSKQVFRIKILLQDGSDLLRAGMIADVQLPAPISR